MVRFLISIPMDLRQQLQEQAVANGQTLTGFIRQILWEWAKNQQKVKQEIRRW